MGSCTWTQSSLVIPNQIKALRKNRKTRKEVLNQSAFLTFFVCVCIQFLLFWDQKIKMQLHISPSLRHVTVFPGKGVREFIKVKVGSRRVSYRMLFYSLLFFTFLLRFVFVMTAVDSIDGETKCSTIGMCYFKVFSFIVSVSLLWKWILILV